MRRKPSQFWTFMSLGLPRAPPCTGPVLNFYVSTDERTDRFEPKNQQFQF